MTSGEHWRLGHRPGLDGLRGVAILLVVAAHARPGGSAGTVGVTVFFALSGFLITSLLLEEHRERGRVSFAGFYQRRARRLLPGLAMYLAVWSTLSALHAEPFPVAPAQVLVALFYMTNWLMAVGGAPHPIGITWSLSVEEQFYLLWPLTFLLSRRWPIAPLFAAIGGTICAVSLRVVMWDGGAGAWAIYYRSDTRMDSLLIGCMFSILVHRGVRFDARWLGPTGVAIVAAFVVNQNALIRGVIEPLVVPVGTCVLVAAVLTGRAAWLTHPVLRWFGRRSYALYLWHYPLAALAWDNVLPMWLAIGLAFAAAEVSWWGVERPFQRRRLVVPAGAPRAGLVGARLRPDPA